ncbi:hypothetical protein [Candidatus Vampirococcus lugosii]|uniref:Uncharacterized protein n=1 Tax=Candidatus Vampirococcus lugosii TaxID=2789015 RepID=A0ABS5QMR1_9BACT|nr:hypothetical protein [Candidatus Vampirococcus lugosii]MBS8122259.1 hypothetical protein [Candidatus Vampirococcus lugosii]
MTENNDYLSSNLIKNMSFGETRKLISSISYQGICGLFSSNKNQLYCLTKRHFLILVSKVNISTNYDYKIHLLDKKGVIQETKFLDCNKINSTLEGIHFGISVGRQNHGNLIRNFIINRAGDLLLFENTFAFDRRVSSLLVGNNKVDGDILDYCIDRTNLIIMVLKNNLSIAFSVEGNTAKVLKYGEFDVFDSFSPQSNKFKIFDDVGNFKEIDANQLV